MTNSYLKKIISVAACAVLTAVFIVVMFFCSPSVGAVPETEGTIARSFFNSETGTVEKETKIIGKDIAATRITDLGLPKKITKVNYVADKFVKLNPFDSDFQIVDLTKPFEFAEKGTLMFVIMNLDSLAEDFDDQAEKLAVYKSGDYWRFTVSLPKIFSASVVYNGANLVAEHGKIQNYNFADFNTSYVKQTDSFSEQTENTLVDIDFYTRRGMQNDVNITIHYQSSGGVYSGLAECPLIGTKDAVKSINDNSQNLLLAITILAVVVLGVLIVLSLLKHTKELMQVYNGYIEKAFTDLTVNEIESFFLQNFINSFTQSERYRTAKKVYNLLSPCFDYAVADGILDRNPMAKVVIPKYEIKQGSPITHEEEKILVKALKKTGNIFAQAFVFLTYTGLRVGELSSVKQDGDWFEAVTEKERKGLKAKIRRIPVSPNLKRCLPLIDVEAIKKLNKNTISRHLSDFIENHHTHDLRHTFVTRAQEVGIRREIVSLWVGHAADSSITTTVYTHLDQNKEIQLQEIKKFDYAV